jgi:hypothetical protein
MCTSIPRGTTRAISARRSTTAEGNIYVAPAPRVNLYDNPPEQQNTIYKVDTDTGELAEYIRLPFAAPMPPENPFGIIGLAYDCDTNSLYAASVYGSGKDAEVGIIYQVDLDTGKVASQLKNIDAFGLGVFNRIAGKRLYFGLTRKSEVWSVALGDDGMIRGKPRFEFSMAGWGADGDDKARRIVFRKADEMFVRGSAFNYNLIAGTERIQTDYFCATIPRKIFGCARMIRNNKYTYSRMFARQLHCRTVRRSATASRTICMSC